MKQPGTTPTTTGTQLNLTTLLPLAVLGIGGIAVYKYFQKKAQEEKEYKENLVGIKIAQDKTAAATTQSKNLSTATYSTGVNMFNKNVTKNVANTAESLRDIFYRIERYVSGRPVYKKRTSVSAEESAKAKKLIFDFPVKRINTLIKWYSFLYPSLNLVKDIELSKGSDKISLVGYFELAKKKGLF